MLVSKGVAYESASDSMLKGPTLVPAVVNFMITDLAIYYKYFIMLDKLVELHFVLLN
jgi:hypothetical protein